LTCGNLAKASPRAAHTERGSPNGCAVSRGCNGFRLARLLLASKFELNLRKVDPNCTGGILPLRPGRKWTFARQIGVKHAIASDHTPTVEGEADGVVGHEMLGRLFAVGYVKGIMETLGTPMSETDHLVLLRRDVL